MSDFRGVLIYGEAVEEKITGVTAEVLNAGRKVADELKEPLSLLLCGPKTQKAADEAILRGADRVYLAEGPDIEESSPEHLAALMTGVCRQLQPSVILFGHTDWGRDVAPRVGARLEASVCLDCVELSIDQKTSSLLQSKPVYGGNALAVWASPASRPRVTTVRPRAFAPAEAHPSRKGEVVAIKVKVDPALIKGKLLENVKEEVQGIALEEAKVIVAGGGGIGGREGFQLLQELAQVLRGAVGISRVPADEGWMPASLEVGQTGHVVSPGLYLAIGISGAAQHLAGCSRAKCIVAINKDPEAHIFQEADFGIIADYREALPALIEKLKALLS